MIITYTADGIIVAPADETQMNEQLGQAVNDEQLRLNQKIAEAAKTLNEAQEIKNITIDAQGNYSITIKNADGKIETLNITEAEKTALSKKLKDGIEA
jgi:archaellum component FlaG (FlaF/FlaG flagellin family)